jgi:hypothetical protein
MEMEECAMDDSAACKSASRGGSVKRGLHISIFLGLVGLFAAGAAAQVPSPEDFLGFKVGSDRQLADMHQIIAYFRLLDQDSERLKVQEVGNTTMGNPFIVAFITSEANHGSLETYRDIQQRLADPRTLNEQEAERMIEEGRAVVMINCSIHATEIAASQMSMELAYDLVTRNDAAVRRILDNVILLLTPMHNPDGIQMVVEWYKKHLGTELEGGRMPWLYNKYVGHDNNRDWFMFTQVETQHTIRVHNDWHPQIIVDMHQMGSSGARLFVPPYVDPYEPNIDPILRQQVAMMGTFIAAQLTAEGKSGVIHSSGYDAWTPARAYHHYHGGIRILTEAASVRVATPITVAPDRLRADVREESARQPLPWKGGEWTLRDIVEYDYAAAWAVLTNAASLRRNWVRNYHRVFRNAISRTAPPYAFVVPRDQRDLATAVKMLNILRMGGVEVHQAERSFEGEGHRFSKDSYIIYVAQPFGGFAKTLLERQVYPEIRETPGGPLKTPYDVVGHTLPLLMGVEVVQVENAFQVERKLLQTIPRPQGQVLRGVDTYGYAWGHASNDDFVALNRLLQAGFSVSWSEGEFNSGGRIFPAGTMLVPNAAGLPERLESLTRDLWVEFIPLELEPAGVSLQAIKPPRLGVYKSWTASMDEGWTRFVLEQFEFPFTSISDAQVRGGGLHKQWDVIILPDMSDRTVVQGLDEGSAPVEYTGGIGEVGVEELRSFLKSGGTLITLNSAADFALKRLHLGVEDGVAGLSRQEFFIPGSLLKVINDTSHPIAYGCERDSAVFFRRSPAFVVGEGSSVVRYPARALLSGWVTGEQHLINRSALVDVPYGKGRVILIGFPAQYRAQSHGSFRYLFNAVYYGASY